jgi:hypothetical protein
MKEIFLGVVLLVSSAVFAQQEQLPDSCKWSREKEKMVLQIASDSNKVLSEEFANCSALNKYYQSLLNQAQIKQTDTNGILLGATQENSSALRVLWILDQYRDEYVNASKTAKYGQVLDLFEKAMTVYFEKLNTLNEKHLAALTSTNPQDILYWQFLGQNYQAQVSSADSNWITNGYKNEIYQLAAKAELKN